MVTDDSSLANMQWNSNDEYHISPNTFNKYFLSRWDQSVYINYYQYFTLTSKLSNVTNTAKSIITAGFIKKIEIDLFKCELNH